MIYCMLAPGFEEIEAILPTDVLRRTNLTVQTVAVHLDPQEKLVMGAHNISLICDINIQEADLTAADLVILPGGMPGTLNLEKNEQLCQALSYRMDNNLPVAAICAAPSILGNLGLIQGRKATCYPGFESQLAGAIHLDQAVVVDDQLVTSKGPGTAMDFALALVSLLKDASTARELAKELQYHL